MSISSIISKSNRKRDSVPNLVWEKRDTKAPKRGRRFSCVSIVSLSLRTISSPNMRPAAGGMTHAIPNHVLQVGQTIRLDPTPEATGRHDDCGDDDLDISLENLNRIILELDPTFEPIHLDKSPPSASPATGRALPRNPLSKRFHFLVLSQVSNTKTRHTKRTQITTCIVQRCDAQHKRKKPHSPSFETNS